MGNVCRLEVALGDWSEVERRKTLVLLLGVYAGVGNE